MKSLSTIILTFIVIALCGVVLYDQWRITALESQPSALKKEQAVAQAAIGRRDRGPGLASGLDRTTSPAEQGSYDAEDASAGIASGSADTSAVADEEASENPLSALAAWALNPAMKSFLRRDAEGRMKATYGPFLEELGADDELAESIYDLLVEREVFAIEKIGTMFDEDAPTAEREAAGSEFEGAWADSENQLRDFLGDEAFSQFKLFEASEPERSELPALREFWKRRRVALLGAGGSAHECDVRGASAVPVHRRLPG